MTQSSPTKPILKPKVQPRQELVELAEENLINNWYEVQRNLFKKAIREYILENRAEVVRANADDCLPVNA